jgi:hypothetical protein
MSQTRSVYPCTIGFGQTSASFTTGGQYDRQPDPQSPSAVGAEEAPRAEGLLQGLIEQGAGQ